MKRTLAGLITLGLVLPALAFAAPTRDELESQALDHANKANEQIGVGVDAFNAGDSVKGCTAFKTANTEMLLAIDLLNQDAVVINADKALTDANHATALAELVQTRNDATTLQGRVAEELQKRCPTA